MNILQSLPPDEFTIAIRAVNKLCQPNSSLFGIFVELKLKILLPRTKIGS